ncbi:MAG TPA: hypothetical protein PL131_04725 [Methylotenera sp.]|nr:hypothetical protein [Methylotenera sp.]HPH05159.1 hypothetical protein [Methylotenera sp.]HPN00523.1 hypothetical protein [Methylotenera sp.]
MLFDVKMTAMKMLNLIRQFFAKKSTKPNAALAWQQAGNQADNAYWLYASPVHLVLQRDTFSLAEPVPVPLAQDEIYKLTLSLNQHFAEDGMQFFWLENRWFLRLEANPKVDTSPPESAINQDITAFLPTGEGAMQWAKFQNELQMLLFNHPVNLARENNRLPAINSIWCDGGGAV